MKITLLIPLAIATAALGYSIGSLTGNPALIPETAPAQVASPAHGDSEREASAQLGVAAMRAFAALTAPTRLEDFAALDSLLAQVAHGDFPKLIAAIERLPSDSKKEQLLAIFRAWIAADRKAAGEWGKQFAVKSLGGFGYSGDDPVRALAEEWSAKFRDDALALARENWPATGAGHILHNYIWRCKKEEFAACLATLQTFPAGQMRDKSIVTHFHHWVQNDFDSALAAARSLEAGPARSSALAQVIISKGQISPEKMLSLAIENGLAVPQLIGMLGEEAGVQKGAEFSKWLEENAPQFIATAGPGLASNWAEKEPAAALAWAVKHGISLTARGNRSEPGGELQFSGWISGHGYNSPLASAMDQQQKQTIEWLLALPAGEHRDSLALHAITASQISTNALPLFTSLPAEKQATAMPQVIRSLFENKSADACEWAKTLPPGAAQDAAWHAIGNTLEVPSDFPLGRARDIMLSGSAISYRIEPPAALALVAKISEPAIQRRAFENVLWKTIQESSQLAAAQKREILESAKFPEAWKASLRELLAP